MRELKLSLRADMLMSSISPSCFWRVHSDLFFAYKLTKQYISLNFSVYRDLMSFRKQCRVLNLDHVRFAHLTNCLLRTTLAHSSILRMHIFHLRCRDNISARTKCIRILFLPTKRQRIGVELGGVKKIE